jgi:hypothetical protein
MGLEEANGREPHCGMTVEAHSAVSRFGGGFLAGDGFREETLGADTPLHVRLPSSTGTWDEEIRSGACCGGVLSASELPKSDP